MPDHPDADDFTGPFLGEGNVPDDDYDADTITESLLPRTAARSDRSATDEDFGRIQDPVAEDVPALPVRQAEQYAVVQDGVYGLERCLDRVPVPGDRQELTPYRRLPRYCAPGRTSPLS